MKIAIPYENGQVFQHFGHSAQFKLYTAEEGRITGAEVVSTDGQGHGALVGFLVRNGVMCCCAAALAAGHRCTGTGRYPSVRWHYRRCRQRCSGLSCRHAGL